MPVAQLCVGQAGNQVGAAALQLTGPLHAGAVRSAPVPGRRPQPGCVFVDSEPKVVRALRTPGAPAYTACVTPESIVHDYNGRGNNWAWGYTSLASHRGNSGRATRSHTAIAGPPAAVEAPLWSRAMDGLRRQAEAVGALDTLLVLQSLGGGTGAGLGSRLLELARDEYPRATLVSVAIAPFAAGDTPLQHFNMALALATAHEVADAVVLFDNDDALARARRTSRRRAVHRGAGASAGGGSGDDVRVTTRDMNDVIAASLAGVVGVTVRARRPARAARRGAGDDGSDDDAPDGRPGWYDVRQDTAVRADATAFGGPRFDSASDDDGGAGVGDGGSDDGCGDEAAVRRWLPCAFDGADFVRALVPSPALKYVDVRCAVDVQPPPPHLAGARPALAQQAVWGDLAEALAEELPTRVAGPHDGGAHAVGAAPPAQQPVVTVAARLVARGVSARDYDSAAADGAELVRAGGDVRARGSRSAPGSGGGAATDAHAWAGLPRTPQWAAVGARVGRALRFAGGRGGSASACSASLSVGHAFRAAGSGAAAAAAVAGAGGWAAVGDCDRSLTVACNSNWMVPALTHCADRATALLRAGAYVHWYERFGITREFVATAVDSVRDAADAYAGLRA